MFVCYLKLYEIKTVYPDARRPDVTSAKRRWRRPCGGCAEDWLRAAAGNLFLFTINWKHQIEQLDTRESRVDVRVVFVCAVSVTSEWTADCYILFILMNVNNSDSSQSYELLEACLSPETLLFSSFAVRDVSGRQPLCSRCAAASQS